MKPEQAQRRCIVTGETLPVTELLRFVRAPDGTLTPDIKQTLPGRGIWLKPSRALIEQAASRKLFSRAAKEGVHVPKDIAERVETLLLQRALAYLHRAKLAGLLLQGFEKVSELCLKGEAAMLIHAEDAAEDGCRKLDKLAGEETPVLRFCPRETLAEALQWPNPVHLGLKKDRIAQAFYDSACRWAGFRDKDGL